jgi:hypothetical protein
MYIIEDGCGCTSDAGVSMLSAVKSSILGATVRVLCFVSIIEGL